MKLRYSLMLGALLILAGTSCEDKLDIPQKGVLDFSTYYKTDEQAQAAADALYIQLKGTYYNYTMMKNALSFNASRRFAVPFTKHFIRQEQA